MKTQVKKLIKSALFGVTVLGGAMAANAWTGEKTQTTMHLVNKGASYEIRTNYSSNNCQLGSQTCAYAVLSPENLPDETSFSPSEIQEFLDNEWIEVDSANGEYLN